MIKVGITGGIGSGKSTVCRIFKVLGIPVFEADSVAKQLMNTDQQIREQLIGLFGSSVYLSDHTLNRKYLAEIVFKNPSLLAKLNAMVHPAVGKAFDDWYLIQQAPYALHEAAILFESGFYKKMDKTIAVIANENERIDRVMQRDKINEELVRQRIKNQLNDTERIKLADYVISNNDNELIIPQILEIDKKIRTNG
ncbi:MAG: dephospho-CoA kinase [Bacteroidota bacterium]|nr:dephospho-CoA kinase [Bacteroidota bacterium]